MKAKVAITRCLLMVVLLATARSAAAQTPPPAGVFPLPPVAETPALETRAPQTVAPAEVVPPGRRGLVEGRLPPVAEDLPNLDGGPLPFPELPPDPYDEATAEQPSLEQELYEHGGSYLYQAEGDRLGYPDPHDPHDHSERLRLPEDWQAPLPMTLFAEFLGADPIQTYPHLKWPGGDGYSWEPRFVGYGSYQLFAFAQEVGDQRQDAIGHQLLLDGDLRLTGTERFHIQFRPLGEQNTGGSYYQFSDPAGYVNNATATPDRYWVEGELHSIFGAWLDPFAVRDIQITVGKFPLALHNNLLINDDILGVIANKNTIYLGTLSNLNVQLLYAWNDVDANVDSESRLYGTNITADWRHQFYELTYIFAQNEYDASRDAHYAALSRTQYFSNLSVTGRALLKFGDEGGTGAGQLFVLETNYTRLPEHPIAGIESAVFYANFFGATAGWTSISGGNFNRLQASFETNPLIRLAAGVAPTSDTWGGALGVQLFRLHEDESIIPEIAFEAPDGAQVFGTGVRYLRKTSARSFFEILGTLNFSDDPQYDRQGIFAAQTFIF